MKKIVILLIFFLLAFPAYGHQLWIMLENGAYTINRGSIIGEKQAYDPGCIKVIHAYNASGDQIEIRRVDESGRTVFNTDEKPALVTALSEWGYRVNTTRGKKLMPPKQAEEKGFKVISAFTSTQFSKNLFERSNQNKKPIGMKFEIVPLADPLDCVPGDTVSFLLLFEGKALPGKAIYTLENKPVMTDGQGIFSLPVHAGNVCLFYAKHKIQAQKGQDINYMQYMTFLTFRTEK